MSKITQKDVARAACVSQSLVSMVLGGKPTDNIVSLERRAKILATAERLGYRPKKKRATKGREKLLVFIGPAVKPEAGREHWLQASIEGFYGRLYEQLQVAALEKGYSTMFYPAKELVKVTQWLSEWDVAGIFWNHSDAELLQWVYPRFPVVQVERYLTREVDAVLADQENLVLVALEHLVAAGHRRVAYISKAPRTDYLAVSRLQAFRFFTRQFGLEEAIEMDGAEEFIKATGDASAVTALIAPDLVVFKVFQSLRRHGRSPEEFAFVGIDNFAACEFSSPRLTSVDLNFRDMAMNALELLEARIAGHESLSRRIFVTPSLKARDSVPHLAAVP